MTIKEVAEIPNAALPFAQMIRNLQEYGATANPARLIKTVARIWTLVDKVPTRHRERVINPLASMLT